MERQTRTAPRLRAAALLAALGLAGCQPRNEYTPPPPPEVTVARPAVRTITEYAEQTGNTQPSEQVDLRSRVQGYLESIRFIDGTFVDKGDLLFVIDQRPFQAKVDAAKATVAANQATVSQNEALYRRTLALLPTRAATPEDVDKQKGAMDQSKGQLLTSQANLHDAELNLGYTEIKAPISGRIGRRLVDLGNLVTADSTKLATIAQYNPMYVYFTVSERDLLRFLKKDVENRTAPPGEEPAGPLPYLVGSAVALLASPTQAPLVAASVLGRKLPRVPLELELANETGYPHKGHIDFVDLGVDTGTGTILVRGTFSNPDPYPLRPGLFVRVRAPVGTREKALLIDERALGMDQKGRYVFVVTKDNKVERRGVEVGIAVGNLRVIDKGLAADDWVIVNGLLKARDGATVNPKRVEQTSTDKAP
jgi:RND family efflux transporter MFP subunit